ncbi:TPA: flagellar export protein FliJ [Candidatus Poribacteria bacterium]|jgi:flagellar FliJ protein|nr:flagellar export protein FliJ [Candidatus Poribacteria bacterium]|tara:strand:+ start:3925 stop:4386 length:462 start_codon:yes stop_codon:yes gene_type:complete
MKKYKFSLDQVLEIRQNIETQRQGEFVQAMRVVDENTDILTGIEEDQQSFLERYHTHQQAGLQPNECIQYHQYFHALEVSIDRQNENIELLREEAEEKRERLEEALRDKLVIEELKKENLRNFQKKLAKTEQMFIDDTSTITYNYRSKNGSGS